MDKPLIKLYAILIATVVLAGFFIPRLIGKTSDALHQAFTRMSLLTNNNVVKVSKSKDKGNIVFIMDDGWESQYTQGFPILDKYGFQGCISVIPSLADHEGYMDYDQMAEIYMKGWDMLNHTCHHSNLQGLTISQQTAEMNEGRDWLTSHMLTRGSDIIVFPGSYYSADTFTIMKENGYIAGRSLKSVWVANQDSSLDNAEIVNLISSLPVEKAKEAVDMVCRDKCTIVFVLHKLETVSDGSQMQYDPGAFEELVAYVGACKAKLNVLTMTELLGREEPD